MVSFPRYPSNLQVVLFFRSKLRVKTPDVANAKSYNSVWQKDRIQNTSRVEPLDGEWFPENRYVNATNVEQPVSGGILVFDAL